MKFIIGLIIGLLIGATITAVTAIAGTNTSYISSEAVWNRCFNSTTNTIAVKGV